MPHNLSDYISLAEAAKSAGVCKSTMHTACKNKAVEAILWEGHWLVLRSSALAYVKRKRGLKLGQKITRPKKMIKN
jgi:hypothetical protein